MIYIEPLCVVTIYRDKHVLIFLFYVCIHLFNCGPKLKKSRPFSIKTKKHCQTRSEPRVLTDSTRSRTSAPRRKALAAKVKVAGAWVHAAELLKPAASRPNPKKTNSPKEKGGGNRPPKGQNDPLKIYNKYGSLEENAGMEVEASQMCLPSSLSGITSSLT